ncbi:hypothetical protein Emed_006828 [Eimeria media]
MSDETRQQKLIARARINENKLPAAAAATAAATATATAAAAATAEGRVDSCSNKDHNSSSNIDTIEEPSRRPPLGCC